MNDDKGLVERFAGHTPGPWSWHQCFDPSGKRVTSLDVVPPNGHTLRGVAVLASVWSNEANARLIAEAPNLLARIQVLSDRIAVLEEATLDEIAAMMGEFVDNWPKPKKISTALALIAKTLRAALDPPKHRFWGAGEPDCPRDIKASNGEIHTLRCKTCGIDSPRDDWCRVGLTPQESSSNAE